MDARRESLHPRHGRAWTVPYLVFGLGLVVTLAAWRAAYRVTEENDRLRFSNSVERTRHAIVGRIEDHLDLLRTTAAMIETQGDIDREQFHRYYKTLGEKQSLSGVRGLGFTYRIRPEDRNEFIARMRRQGWPNFKIFPPGGEEHAVAYIEPLDRRNLRAIGLNMHEYSPERRRAMDLARDSGKEAMSAMVQLVQEIESDVQPGFLIYYPVYREGDPETVEGRRKRLLGFVYSPFRSKDLFDPVLQAERGLDIAVEIYDGGILDRRHLLYSDLPPGRVAAEQYLSFDLAQQRWGIRYVALPSFEAGSGQRIVAWIPVVGALISLLLAGLSFLQATAHREVEVQAEELHRREYQQRLLAQAGNILGMSLDVDHTLSAVANLAVPSFADWCAVDLVDEQGGIRRVAVAHIDPDKTRWARELQEKYPPDPEAATGVPNVVRTGKSELYSHIPRELLEEAAKTDELREILRQLALESAIIVPLTARGRTLGVISFIWAESGFHYDEEDLRLAEEIGARAGLAVDNARLYQAAQELNENLEHLVKERTTELEASNQELEAFCYSVSHDLRSPLRSVDGFSKAVIEDYGEALDEQAIGYLQRVRAAATRMDLLITALLNLSRLTRAEIHRQDIDLTELVEEAAKDAIQGAKPEPEVRIEPGMRINGDPRMVRIVLDNLLGNAVKFSARSERPLIEVGMKGGSVFVRDNGVGFNPEYGNKLFGPFERLHSPNEFPGSGIGLATVQRIVVRHGGQVWAESQEGHGATFWFNLGE